MFAKTREAAGLPLSQTYITTSNCNCLKGRTSESEVTSRLFVTFSSLFIRLTFELVAIKPVFNRVHFVKQFIHLTQIVSLPVIEEVFLVKIILQQ
jgi:hypothetical protein